MGNGDTVLADFFEFCVGLKRRVDQASNLVMRSHPLFRPSCERLRVEVHLAIFVKVDVAVAFLLFQRLRFGDFSGVVDRNCISCADMLSYNKGMARIKARGGVPIDIWNQLAMGQINGTTPLFGLVRIGIQVYLLLAGHRDGLKSFFVKSQANRL